MPDDPPPPPRPRDPIAARLRAWGTLVTALAGLATAIWKPQDQSVTKAAYQQCTEGIEKLNDGLAQEHQELATLRGYVAAKDGQLLLLAPAPVDAGVTPLPPPPPPPKRVQAPKPTASAPPPPVASAVVAAAVAPEPPPAAPAPAVFHPVDFDTVLKSVK